MPRPQRRRSPRVPDRTASRRDRGPGTRPRRPRPEGCGTTVPGGTSATVGTAPSQAAVSQKTRKSRPLRRPRRWRSAAAASKRQGSWTRRGATRSRCAAGSRLSRSMPAPPLPRRSLAPAAIRRSGLSCSGRRSVRTASRLQAYRAWRRTRWRRRTGPRSGAAAKVRNGAAAASSSEVLRPATIARRAASVGRTGFPVVPADGGEADSESVPSRRPRSTNFRLPPPLSALRSAPAAPPYPATPPTTRPRPAAPNPPAPGFAAVL